MQKSQPVNQKSQPLKQKSQSVDQNAENGEIDRRAVARLGGNRQAVKLGTGQFPDGPGPIFCDFYDLFGLGLLYASAPAPCAPGLSLRVFVYDLPPRFNVGMVDRRNKAETPITFDAAVQWREFGGVDADGSSLLGGALPFLTLYSERFVGLKRDVVALRWFEVVAVADAVGGSLVAGLRLGVGTVVRVVGGWRVKGVAVKWCWFGDLVWNWAADVIVGDVKAEKEAEGGCLLWNLAGEAHHSAV
ncbi:hypothetical protein V8G54_036324 [Vigna mungo]|uniref:Uncharacterized protein n=1 Tax=Vigna mungo TaxID=3915 RepID=A0AAQ3MGV3_VIGMU